MSSADFQKCQCQHCGGRIEFPAQYAGQTIPCPHCQRETKLISPAESAPALAPIASVSATEAPVKKKSSKTVAIAITSVLAIVIGGIAFWFIRKKQAERDAKAVQVLTWKMEPAEYRTFYLVGTVTNSSDKPIRNVGVEFNLVDNLSQPSGTASEFKDVLEPHGAWHFKITTSPTQTVWDAKLNGVVVGKK